jgi:DNA polymerase IV
MAATSARRKQSSPAQVRTPAPLRVVRVPQPETRLASDPTILHVRIDAFAVAVAVRSQPALRDRALLVGGDAQGRGAVLAASAQAQEQGVRSGMALRAAEKLCPHAVVLPADPVAITAAAHDLLALLGAYTPVLEPAWIAPATARKAAVVDEERLARCFGATLDVRGCERLFGPPTTIAARISLEIEGRGYGARIGVAGNPYLAAVAASVAGAERPVIVPAGHEQDFMETIPLTLIEGLDPDLLERLRGLGIRAAGQFARLPEAAVRRRFGQAGRAAHEQARGAARRAVLAPPAQTVLEATCALEDATVDGQWLDRELARLADRLAEQLAAVGQSAALLTLAVELTAGTRSRRLYLKQPVAGAPALLARARELLAQVGPGMDMPVAGLRLQAAKLGPAAAQLALPHVDAKLAGHEKLEAVAQRLRGRFGPRAARRVHLVVDAVLPEDRVVWDGPANVPAPQARPIEARVDAAGRPAAIRRHGYGWETLRAIRGQWRIRANWWDTPADRHYYLVETECGAVREIYRDQGAGAWLLVGTRD